MKDAQSSSRLTMMSSSSLKVFLTRKICVYELISPSSRVSWTLAWLQSSLACSVFELD